ncbi:MAG: DNA-deoxyinosine glycosylase [Bacteroidales bacterium]|nr:DNA-deoxyinosine glycosylase [Bacteroidales bacterium]
MKERKLGLAPLVGDNPRVLVLGSLPGDESIRRQEYYGHPKNLFWRVLAAVFDDSVPYSYSDKKAFLAKHHVALWDVLSSADRKGSLDSKIQGEERNDIAGFLAEHSSIKCIVLNGGKAAREFKKIQKVSPWVFRDIAICEFTSTSPLSVSAGWPFERIVAQWKQILVEYD